MFRHSGHHRVMGARTFGGPRGDGFRDGHSNLDLPSEMPAAQEQLSRPGIDLNWRSLLMERRATFKNETVEWTLPRDTLARLGILHCAQTEVSTSNVFVPSFRSTIAPAHTTLKPEITLKKLQKHPHWVSCKSSRFNNPCNCKAVRIFIVQRFAAAPFAGFHVASDD